MAHQLTVREDGKVEMFSGQNITPWHKLGKVVAGLLTAEEAIKAANLDWTVSKQPIHCNGVLVKDKFAIQRDDNKQVLEILGNRYAVIQNNNCFGFFDDVVGGGQAIYDTAGSLKGGAKVWIMAKLNGQLFVDTRPDDVIDKNVLLVTSHDGSASLSMQIVSTRVVCANTLSVALGEATNEIRIRHTPSFALKKNEAMKALKLCTAYFDDLQTVINELNAVSMNKVEMERFAESLVPFSKEKDPEKATRTINIRKEITDLFSTGKGNLGKSRWDALNAVTEFVDYERTTRTKGATSEAESRFSSSMFGSGALLKARAFGLLKV